MVVVTLLRFFAFFTKKKPLQKRETREKFLIFCAKKVDPPFVFCAIQLVKKEGKRCLCLFTLKRIKTDTRHTHKYESRIVRF